MAQGYGYEVTGFDVMDAYRFTIEAAEQVGARAATEDRIQQLLARDNPPVTFIKEVLKHQLGSS